MQWFERIISQGGTLQGKARSDRRLLLIVGLLQVLTAVSFVGVSVTPIRFLCVGLGAANGSVIMILCVCGVTISKQARRIYVVVWGAGMILVDLSARSSGGLPVWPLFVLLADLSLVLRLGRRFATGLVATVALWIFISVAESVWRFGLFDLPGLASQESRWERGWSHVQCTVPPCPVTLNIGFVDLIASFTVLLIDFGATRGFAEEVEKEQAAMSCTIETVEVIAKLLAGYDVDTVAEMLQEAEAEGRLPAAMHEALHRLEQNLRAYRPYLPKSCLPMSLRSELEENKSVTESDTPSGVPTTPGRVPVEKVMRRLGQLTITTGTMMIVNAQGSGSIIEEDHLKFATLFESLLAMAISAVEKQRGLVDEFIGDRILASFNASRPCLVHAGNAAHAAASLIRASQASWGNEMRINIGAATGRVHCGDMGCAEMRRFSLLGTLPVLACGMERAARAFGLDILCNTAMQRDSEHEHVLLLVPRLVRLVKTSASDRDVVSNAVGHEPILQHVYSLLVSSEPKKERAGEWLYHIEKGSLSGPYNRAVRAFLEGAQLTAALAMAGSHSAIVQQCLRRHGHTSSPLLIYV